MKKMLKMTYSKIFLIVLSLLIMPLSVNAFNSTDWKEVYRSETFQKDGVNQVLVDADSVNIHNNSIYYAVLYFKGTVGGVVSIMQYKDGKLGTVETYTNQKYTDIMHSGYYEPARTEKEATSFKEIKPDSFIYKANELAKQIAKYKK